MNPEYDDGLGGLRFARVLVWIVYALVLFAVFVLGFAFFFKLTDANPDASFVDWIYGMSDTLAAPFREIWEATESDGGSVFDWSLLFAMFMYLLVAIGVHAIISAIDRRMLQRRRDQWALRQQELEAAEVARNRQTVGVPNDQPPPPPPPTAY